MNGQPLEKRGNHGQTPIPGSVSGSIPPSTVRPNPVASFANDGEGSAYCFATWAKSTTG
jgi:hypothetical protein